MIQDQTVEDGEKGTNSLDGIAEKESIKQPTFLSEKELTDHCTTMDIPNQATILRTKGGKVKFYTGDIPVSSQNGWHEIPIKGVGRTVNFPDHREASGKYGGPRYGTRPR